jgi:hypothetical protein
VELYSGSSQGNMIGCGLWSILGREDVKLLMVVIFNKTGDGKMILYQPKSGWPNLKGNYAYCTEKRLDGQCYCAGTTFYGLCS